MFVNKYKYLLYYKYLIFIFNIYIIFYNYKIINFWYKYKNLYNFILLIIFFKKNLNLDKTILFASAPHSPSHGTGQDSTKPSTTYVTKRY